MMSQQKKQRYSFTRRYNFISLINPRLPFPQIRKRKCTTCSACPPKPPRIIHPSNQTLIPLDNTVTSNSALIPNNILPSHNIIIPSYNNTILLLDDPIIPSDDTSTPA